MNVVGRGAQIAVKYLGHQLKIHLTTRMQMGQRQKEKGFVLRAAGKQLKFMVAEEPKVL